MQKSVSGQWSYRCYTVSAQCIVNEKIKHKKAKLP